MYIRDYNKTNTLYDNDAFIVDGSQETMYILVSDLYYALVGSKHFVTESALEKKGYQTAHSVDAAIEAKGYLTPNEINTLVNNKGYQTAQDVDDAIMAKGYQTSMDVNTIITSKGYITGDDLTNQLNSILAGYVTNDALNAKGYQTSQQVESTITKKGYQTESQVNDLIDSKLGGFDTSVDLSNYVTKTDLANTLNGYAKGQGVSFFVRNGNLIVSYDDGT